MFPVNGSHITGFTIELGLRDRFRLTAGVKLQKRSALDEYSREIRALLHALLLSLIKASNRQSSDKAFKHSDRVVFRALFVDGDRVAHSF